MIKKTNEIPMSKIENNEARSIIEEEAEIAYKKSFRFSDEDYQRYED